MFSFSFEVDEEGDLVAADAPSTSTAASAISTAPNDAPSASTAVEVPLDELLAALPARISFSPLAIPCGDGSPNISIARRDLYDARFQIISGGEDDAEQEATAAAPGLEFLDAPSDLVRGSYEGGFKTWECAADLVAVLARGRGIGDMKSVLEVGCGTAIPSAYVLGQLLDHATGEGVDLSTPRELHVQDYNRLVLELVTLPNLILAWYFSPLGLKLRDASHIQSTAGELELDASLIEAFRTSLHDHAVSLRFYAGGWDAWTVPRTYDLILSSETVYEPASLGALGRVLHASGSPNTRRLVAAKCVYFGVGGGLREFELEVARQGGYVDTVWETAHGVARAVVEVRWS